MELNGNGEAMAKVLQVDSMLAQIHFENVNRYEWIYLGSPRIISIYRELIKHKRLDNMIEYKTYKTRLSANDDVVMFDFVETLDKSAKDPNRNENTPLSKLKMDIVMPPKHDCSHLCVKLEDGPEIDIKLKQLSAFQKPLLTDWKVKRFENEKKYYVAPCGVSLNTLDAVDKFLFLTDSKLRIDCFDYSQKCEIPRLPRKAVSNVEVSV